MKDSAHVAAKHQWLRRLGGYALGLLFLLATFVLPSALVVWNARDTLKARRASEERVGPLELGMSQETLRRQAGAPDELCQDKNLYLDGYMVKSSRHRHRTASWWIYYCDPADRASRPCQPAYNDTILGFSQDGNLIWFIRFMGESEFQADGE